MTPPPLHLAAVPPPSEHEAPLVPAGGPAPRTGGAGPSRNGALLLPVTGSSRSGLKIGGDEVNLVSSCLKFWNVGAILKLSDSTCPFDLQNMFTMTALYF